MIVLGSVLKSGSMRILFCLPGFNRILPRPEQSFSDFEKKKKKHFCPRTSPQRTPPTPRVIKNTISLKRGFKNMNGKGLKGIILA